VWIFAVVGILIQITTLAGPQALRRFKWFPANLLALASSLGAGLLAIALAIALNHAGTDQIDDITISSVFWEVFFYSLLALILAAISSGVTASLGDRLLRHFKQQQTVLMLAATTLIGLGCGSLFGWLVRQG
jgi:H+/Cl- antiporter ClcA